MKKITKVFYLLLFLVFVKGLIWSFFIPLWQFPDEQEHFGHVSCNSELKINCREAPIYEDMSEEIVTSLNLLDVNRDSNGNNKFTYHPEYNIPYSKSLTGLSEDKILNLGYDTRKNMVRQDSAYYPELFYNISKIPYNLVYSASLFDRVFAVRIFWLPALLIIVWVGFEISKILKPQSKIFPIAVSIGIGFHSMLSFVASGVTSDNILNLLFPLVILELVYLIRYGFKLQFIIFLLIFVYLGVNSKPQFYIVFGLIAPLAISYLFKLLTMKNSWKFIYTFFVALVVSFIMLFFQKQLLKFILESINMFHTTNRTDRPDYSLLDHAFWTFNHTIREVIPWYWGVYRWLSLVLPRIINQISMRIVLIGFIGTIIGIIQNIFKKQTKSVKVYYFLIYSVFMYVISIFLWDWNFVRTFSFSFGIQGRYYFPIIVPLMILLITGIETLAIYLGKIINLTGVKISQFLIEKIVLTIISLWFIFLGTFSPYWVISSYYDKSNFKNFILQASQYKPWFAKGIYLKTLLLIFIASLLVFIFSFVKIILKSNEK